MDKKISPLADMALFFNTTIREAKEKEQDDGFEKQLARDFADAAELEAKDPFILLREVDYQTSGCSVNHIHFTATMREVIGDNDIPDYDGSKNIRSNSGILQDTKEIIQEKLNINGLRLIDFNISNTQEISIDKTQCIFHTHLNFTFEDPDNPVIRKPLKVISMEKEQGEDDLFYPSDGEGIDHLDFDKWHLN